MVGVSKFDVRLQWIRTGKGKCPFATQVTINLGGSQVAKTTLGGRWNEAQILAELKKNPDRFNLQMPQGVVRLIA